MCDCGLLRVQGYCKTLNGDFSEGSVEVHPDYFHLLIGPGGANIQKLQVFFLTLTSTFPVMFQSSFFYN